MATAPQGMPNREPMIDRSTGLVSKPWQAFFYRLLGQSAAAGDVTHTGALIANELVVGNSGGDIKSLGSFGAAGQILTSQGSGSVPAFLTPSLASGTGLLGNDGDDGLNGLPGVPGAAGAAGAAGATGAAGFGLPGTDGDDGLDGLPGPAGSAGATGPQGPAGVSVQNLIGTDGDDGDPGFPGAAGPAGAAGATGPPGAAGLTLIGWDGDDGIDGLPGATGAAGSSSAATLGVPIVVDTNTTLTTDNGMVVPESLEIASGVIFEIVGGARVEVTGPASNVIDHVGVLDIVNTGTETELYGFNIPAGTIFPGGPVVIADLWGDLLNNTGLGNDTITLKMKYGSTTMYSDTGPWASNAARAPWSMRVTIGDTTDKTSQFVTMNFLAGSRGGATIGNSDFSINGLQFTVLTGTATEDSTTTLRFSITIQHSLVSTLASWRRMYGTLIVQ